MNDTAIAVEETVFVGHEEILTGPNCAIEVNEDCISSAAGWHAHAAATLPDAEFTDHPPALPYSQRAAAIIDACERLTSWCSEQKESGGKKHKRQAQEVQDWALALARSTAKAAAEQVSATAEPEASIGFKEPQPHEASGSTLQAPAIQKNVSASPSDKSNPSGDKRSGTEQNNIAPQLFSVALLRESPLNPRQYVSDAEIDSLAESMRKSGFRPWQPIVARPCAAVDGMAEIAAGHRRRLAAIRAGLTEVPCIIRPMSDEEFEDVLNFDNSGREDVHPLHEAAGWRGLMERRGLTVLDIAGRVGRSKEYVYQRLQYANLIEDATEAFLDDRIDETKATEIARLTPRYQRAALEFCSPTWDTERQISSRELKDWIKRNCYLSLIDASFDPADETLLPVSGSCVSCPKRAGSNPELFSDLPDYVCTDPQCYHLKARTAEERKPKPEAAAPVVETPASEPESPSAREAREAEEQRQKDLRKSEKEYRKFQLEEQQRRQEEQRKQDQARAAETEKLQENAERADRVCRHTMEAILERITWPISRDDFQILTVGLMGLLETVEDVADKFAIAKSIPGNRLFDLAAALPKLSPQKIARIAIAGILLEAQHLDGPDSRVLQTLAKLHKVDRKAIEARVAAELHPKPEAPKQATRKASIGKLPALNPPTAKKAAPKKAAAKLDPATRKKIADQQKKHWAGKK